jgi:hypothetical protein
MNYRSLDADPDLPLALGSGFAHNSPLVPMPYPGFFLEACKWSCVIHHTSVPTAEGTISFPCLNGQYFAVALRLTNTCAQALFPFS